MPLGIVSLLPMIVVALAAPIMLWALPRGAARRLVAAGAATLFLAHAGLYVLFYSRLACWLLVGLAAVVATWAAFPQRRAAPAATALVALALGVAFQLTPGDVGILVYVGAAAPLLLGASLALLASASLRQSSTPLATSGAALLALFAGLIPFTSFFPVFLLLFEPLHLGPLGLALAGLALLAAARPARPATWGEVAARPGVPLGLARACATGGAVLAAAAGVASALAPFAAAALLVLSLLALRAPAARLAICCALALGLAGIVAAQSALDLHVRGGAGALRLALASLAASALAFGLGLAAGAARDARIRERALDARGIPEGALVIEGEPTPAAVDALAARVRPGQVGVLRVVAPRGEPWWTLPDATYEALLARGVHAAIVDGGEVSILPPILEVDAA